MQRVKYVVAKEEWWKNRHYGEVKRYLPVDMPGTWFEVLRENRVI